jgi:hypothetical protein
MVPGWMNFVPPQPHQPVFDLVPLAGSRRVVTDRDGHLAFSRQMPQVELPPAVPISVASAGVGAVTMK